MGRLAAVLSFLGLDEVDAQLIGAAATAAGVFVALWIALRADSWRARKRQPKLTIEAVGHGPMGVALRVVNAANRDTARNVEVIVRNVEHHPINAVKQPPKQASAVEHVNESLKWPDGSFRIDIHPGLQREIEVARVVGWLNSPSDPPPAVIKLPSGERALDLTVAEDERGGFPMAYFDDALKNAPARVRFALVADNVNAAYHTLEITWPWDLPWSAMVGRSGHTVRLLTGHAAVSADPHLVAGGPWGETARTHVDRSRPAVDDPVTRDDATDEKAP